LEQFNFETLHPALYGEALLLSSSVSCCAATAEASLLSSSVASFVATAEASLLSSSVASFVATAEANFAYACGAGGGARRQSISTFSMLKCSKRHKFCLSMFTRIGGGLCFLQPFL
jgi:hypothetical protein